MQKIAIQTKALTRHFGNRLVVDKINLLVPEASVYGFLGPNGAGKTTTIRMLLGLIKPDAGEVKLLGDELISNRQKLMKQIGALVENPSLYPHLTGKENLEVTRRLLGISPKSIDEALDIVKLSSDAHRYVREYSLGMRQRLGLALALLNKPKLLILDEPTNGLDPAGIHQMRDLIRRLPIEFGITVFLSSHLLSEVEQIANYLGIIHQGCLLFQGTLAELHAQQEEQISIGVKQLDQAISCLAMAGWKVQRQEGEFLFLPFTTREKASEINALLVSQKIEVFHLTVSQTSLEDIFLKLTNGKPFERNPL